MLKVSILTSSFLPTVGGLQYELKWFLDNLDRRLDEDGNTQVYFAYPNERSTAYTLFKNIRPYDLRLGDLRKPTIARMLMRLGMFLRKTKPNVVHCHSILPDGFWVLAASRIFGVRTKVVVTSHGQDIVSLPQWSYGEHTRSTKSLTRYVTGRIAMHVLPSKAIVEHAMRAGSPQKNMIIIPNGVPLDDDYDFEKDAVFSPPSLHGMDLSDGEGFNILSLSSGREIKNLDALIEAFSRVRHRMGKSRLLLACHGESSERIVGLVNEKGLDRHVLFIGEIAGPVKEEYFRASQVYCNVSHFENFPISLLEAMKYGSAVVAGRVGGIPEFVEDGKNGLLISPTNVDEIASALLRLYEDESLRSRLVEDGLRTVRKYSISRTIDEHVALYRRVA